MDVILVDEADQPTGTCEKMEAHRKGLLHRAFSVFIFDSKGQMLLQQRALDKYHSPGLWTNACCSHPFPGEDTKTAALRRLQEELGFQTDVEKIFDFIYKAEFDNGLIEYEFDHVFVGEYEQVININKEEVMNVEYKSMAVIQAELLIDDSPYTSWFRLAFPQIQTWWDQRYGIEQL